MYYKSQIMVPAKFFDSKTQCDNVCSSATYKYILSYNFHWNKIIATNDDNFVIQQLTKNCCEYFNKNSKLQPYFDLECYENVDVSNIFCSLFSKFCVKYGLGTPKYYISDASGFRDGIYKASSHIIVRGLGHSDILGCRKIAHVFINQFKDQLTYKGKHNKNMNIVDLSVYKQKGQLFRLPPGQISNKHTLHLKIKKKQGNYVRVPVSKMIKWGKEKYLLNYLAQNHETNIFPISTFSDINLNLDCNGNKIKSKNYTSSYPPIDECISYQGLDDYEPLKNDYSPEFLLSCIPAHTQGYYGWMYIGMIIHNENLPYSLFRKWSSHYPNFDEQSCKSLWRGYKGSKKMYNLNTLMRIAKKARPNLFVQTEYYTDEFFLPNVNKITYDTPYVLNDDIHEIDDSNDLIIVKSQMGTGKSYAFRKLIQKHKDKRILILSSRIMYGRNVMSEIEQETGVSFSSYSMFPNKRYMSSAQYLVSTIHSSHYIDTPYDIIIIDECESILFSLIEECFDCWDTMNNLKYLLSKASIRIFGDAFLGNNTLAFINNCVKFERGIFYNNLRKPAQKCIKECEFSYIRGGLFGQPFELPPFIQQLYYSLRAGRKCVFISGERNFAHKTLVILRRFFPKKKMALYMGNSDDRKPMNGDFIINRQDKQLHLTDVNKFWGDLDLLCYTSAITCGVNFTKHHFDELFIFYSVNGCHVRDTIQSSCRVRHFSTPNIYITINSQLIRPKGNLPLNKNEIITEIVNNEEYCKKHHIKNYDLDVWQLDLMASAIQEKNMSIRKPFTLFRHFFELMNWSKKKKIKLSPMTVKQNLSSICRLPNNFWKNYALSPEQYNDIIRDSYTFQASELEIFKAFLHRIYVDYLQGEIKYDDNMIPYYENHYFDTFYGLFKNKIQEKHIINTQIELSFSLQQFAKIYSEKRVLNCNKNTYRQLSSIKKICDILQIENSFDPKLFSKDDIIAISPSINSLLPELITTFGLKNRYRQPLTTKGTISIISSCFHYWNHQSFGIFASNLKYVNGKRTRIPQYGIIMNPYISSDIIKKLT